MFDMRNISLHVSSTDHGRSKMMIQVWVWRSYRPPVVIVIAIISSSSSSIVAARLHLQEAELWLWGWMHQAMAWSSGLKLISWELLGAQHFHEVSCIILAIRRLRTISEIPSMPKSTFKYVRSLCTDLTILLTRLALWNLERINYSQ